MKEPKSPSIVSRQLKLLSLSILRNSKSGPVLITNHYGDILQSGPQKQVLNKKKNQVLVVFPQIKVQIPT